MKESIKDKFKRFYKDIEKNLGKDISAWQKLKVTVDFLWERFRYDIELIDYIQYRFYYKKKMERRNFATHGELVRVIKACNNPEHRKIFDEKPLFNKYFNEYLGRKWLYAGDSDKMKIEEFLNDHEFVFVKDPKGMFGKGVELLDQESKKDPALIDRIIAKKLLLEEKLTQCKELAEFNSTSINSMRVVTLNTLNEGIKVMAGVLRLGRDGKFADNFHHQGIASLIDIESGLVFTRGVDREWNRYTVHPDSKKAIVGFRIPRWEDIKKLLKKAALVYPDVRYIGWDVTIKEDGSIVLIEGNPGGDFDVTQIPDQIGKWPIFEGYIKEIEDAKK